MSNDVVILPDPLPKTLVKKSAQILHSIMSRGPNRLARAYIGLLSLVSRRLPKPMGARICNSVSKCDWPEIKFEPKTVSVGYKARISLIPHMREFDQVALFMDTLDYEAPVFEWLAENAPEKYDLIIEIGANVGLYTVFFDSLARLPRSKLLKIIAFEPSPEAFGRLIENLRANKVRYVRALQAAIGTVSGLQTFFEPRDHLTNGSLIRDFSELFSRAITETEVVVIAAAELERFLSKAQKTLIKIDVEGFEPVLVTYLGGLIQKYRPDLLIEVLDRTAEQIEKQPALREYRRFLITSEGLREAQHLFAHPSCRDWLLLFERTPSAKSSACATPSAAASI